MTTKSTGKPLTKLQEMNLRALRLKEESITTILTTIKNNQTFAKLLIFTLNSLETFVSPPNREISVNSGIIIRLDGVELLHLISLKNIKSDEIVELAGDIIYKLISVHDIIDKDLAKLFTEKNGHKAVIEIILKKQKGDKCLLPYIKIINGLVQIPQLVPTLIDNNIIEAINLLSDSDKKYDGNSIKINLDTLNQISRQKAGRDYLINNNYIEKIINNIIKSSDKKDVEPVLYGLGILENLCRNEEGKKAVKNSNCIECLCHVLTQLGHDQSILKMCAKIYGKIASPDDMKAQLELLRKYYEENKKTGIYDNNFIEINKSLELVSNFMLVDELGLQLQEIDNFELLKQLFIQIQQIDISQKDKNFINLFIPLNKNFMVIFFRLFNLVPTILEKNGDLMKYILDSIQKNWESIKNIDDNELLKHFNSYFVSYGEIVNQNYNFIKKNNISQVEPEFENNLIYLNSNILASGQKNLNVDENDSNPHCIACRLIKICDELSLKENPKIKASKTGDIVSSLINCYSYLEYLFINKEDEEILCNTLDVIYDLVSAQKDFRHNKLEQIIFKICDFMNKKEEQRYPCLQCMKLLDMYLTPEYLAEYLKSNDPTKYPSHSINYIECIVNVMTYRKSPEEESKKKSGVITPIQSAKVEEEINSLGGALLEKLIDEFDFRKLLKEFIDNAESFDPSKNNQDSINKLENSTKNMYGIMNVKNYYEIGAYYILKALRELLTKEIRYIEFFKRDKTNEKNPDFKNIVDNASSRMNLELSLNLKINEISQQKLNYEYYSTNLDILFLFLTKSLDKKNIKYLLNHLNNNYNFILDNESNIKLEGNENVSEKMVNVDVSLLRKLIEEDDVIDSIIHSLIILAENNILLCNNMVKAGCPRLLLQIIESSPNEANVESALYLLKIISFSNKDNLIIVANQNPLNVFYHVKKKYSSNEKILNHCTDITKEILKLPGQEKYVSDIITNTINKFNEYSKKDFAQDEVRQQLLNSLQIINSFVTNQELSELINNNEEFLENFKNVTENTFKEKELDSINEKLVSNELSLLTKLNNNKVFQYDFTVDKVIDIIKNKSKYQDILLNATDEMLKNLANQSSYEKYIANKVDNSFVDCIFDDIENYLGNIKVTKELNNILCYLCLYNEDLANYIKQKGGLANVLEELKLNINTNDKNSQFMKLSSLKMLYSLCKDKNGIESFLKAGGVDLLNKIIENEIELYKDYFNNFENDLYKTRDILSLLNIFTNTEKSKENEKGESYVTYSIKLLKNIIEYDEKYFNNDKIINNLVFLSEVKYPDKEIFTELFSLFSINSKYLPNEEKFLYLLFKNALSLKIKYLTEKEFVQNIINKNNEIILPIISSSNNYLNGLRNSLNRNRINPLQLTYLSEYIDNEKYNKSLLSIFDDLVKFAKDYFVYYKEKALKKIQEEIPEGVIICLQELLLFILKNKKDDENSPKINDIVNTFTFFGQQYLYKTGHDLFSLYYLQKCDSIFDNVENNEIKNICYKNYLEIVTPKSLEILKYIHQILLNKSSYSDLDGTMKPLFDLIIKNMKSFYSDKNANIELIKFDVIVNIISDLINDFNNVGNIEEEKRNKIINDLYDILMRLLSQDKLTKEILNANDKLLLKLFSSMKSSKEKKYPLESSTFPKIINTIVHKADLNHEPLEKALEFILDDLKETPPKELDINLDSLAALSKDISTMKHLITNDQLTSVLLNVYNDNQNLTLPQRRNISTIFNNLSKNTFNVENIIENKPEIIKSIVDKVVQKENVIKDAENIDIPQKELSNITSILKDKNNSSLIVEKGLFVPENIPQIIDNYKDTHESLNDLLNELQNIFDILTNKKDKEDNYKLDRAILNNLKEKIKQAFDEHLNELKKLNTDEFNNASNDTQAPNDNHLIDNNLLESSSNMKKRRLSLISHHLFYDPYNSKITSPISLKSHEDMSSCLDSLLALIRLIYSNNKDFKDKDIQEQRLSLLKDAFDTLKMFTICPENHKTLEEVGLLNFMEKLNQEEIEDFKIYLNSLDSLKNCTWSENAVLSLIETNLFDKIIDEVIKFYNNPELLSENEDNLECFFYDNIILSNISKVNKGFEAIFKKIGIEKLLKICKNTGNTYFLTSCVMVLNNYLENGKMNNNELDLNNQELISDILEICKKGFNSNVNELNDNLFFKTMKLIGNIYNDYSKDYIGQMDIVQIINLTFDKYKNEPEYFYNAIFILKIVCLYHKHYSDEIVDLKLINKIVAHIMTIEQKDDLISNYSALLYHLLVYNEDNINKMCSEEIISNDLSFIEKYSQKLDISKEQKLQNEVISLRATIATINNNITIAENVPKEDDKLEITNQILNNFLKVLYYLTTTDNSNQFIINDRYNQSLIHTISKPKLDINNVNVSLFCLANYYSRISKDNWKSDHIDEIYRLLQSVHMTYYTNGDILINVNNLIGFILRGLNTITIIEKYYCLAIEGLNCQDWNEQLALLTLQIIKQCLIDHPDLRKDVYEVTKHLVLNTLKLFQSNLIIQILGYEILVLFTENGKYAYELANTDIFRLIRTTLSNKDFNIEPDKRLTVRLNIYKILNYLAFDKTINLTISFELMESFIRDLMGETFTEDLNEMSYLLVTLFKTKLSIEPFIQFSGLSVLCLCFQKFYDQKKFILNCFLMLKEICFSSPENKDRLLNLNIQEKIQMVIDNSRPEDKKIKYEGKILIYNINYDRNNMPKSAYSPPLNLIEKEKMIKNVIYNFMVKGIQVKASNPRGKIKDFILAFSPDLMKIYLKKPKLEVIPPKAKYTLETPLVSEVIRNYEIINFKKSGLHNKPPEREVCFAIVQNLLEGQKIPKKLIIICSNTIECFQLSGCSEIIIDYIKTKCEKQYTCKIEDLQSFFTSLMLNQPKENPSHRKRTILMRGKFK